MRLALPLALVIAALALNAPGADWVRAGANTNAAVWGLRGGLLWAVPPGGFRGGEPRGLIRLGSPVLPSGGYDLINFIAVEPIVNGRRGFSELERSRLDDRPGLRLWANEAIGGDKPTTNLIAGTIQRLTNGVEQLQVPLRVETFANGAHVRLVVRQRSDRPDEIEFTVHAEPDSASIEFCVLTATMGNLARLRQLWLQDEVISSLQLYPDYRGIDFAPHTVFALKRLHRTPTGDVLVAATTDEENPAAVYPFQRSGRWHYGGFKVTQYWRKPAADIGDDLHAVVNARHTYWRSRRPIPGGIAFENFELREPFHEGQRFIFGITRKTPEELGFTSRPAAETPPRR
jgi:hypothetical protein